MGLQKAATSYMSRAESLIQSYYTGSFSMLQISWGQNKRCWYSVQTGYAKKYKVLFSFNNKKYKY